MLTVEMLRQNGSLSGLTDEQFQAIATMSQNDENTVIGAKIGALHGQYDTDIFNITGVVKNQSEKSYDYAKRVLTQYKNQLASTATIQAQLANAKKEVETFKQKLADGAGDEQLKQQLKDAKNQVTQLQQQLTQKQTELDTAKQDHIKQIKDLQFDNAFQAAVSSIKFKAGVSETIKNVLINAAKSEVLSKGTPDFIDKDGKQVLVFRDANGVILNNPKNNLNPYTAQELVMETAIKDVIDTGKQQQGTGTKPGEGGHLSGNTATIIDLSTAKTQVEADKIIENYLLSNGLTRDSAEFAQQSMTIRNENEVGNLPIR